MATKIRQEAVGREASVAFRALYYERRDARAGPGEERRGRQGGGGGEGRRMACRRTKKITASRRAKTQTADEKHPKAPRKELEKGCGGPIRRSQSQKTKERCVIADPRFNSRLFALVGQSAGDTEVHKHGPRCREADSIIAAVGRRYGRGREDLSYVTTHGNLGPI